jgi:4-amino-4-deoxy-L-arabinose transferase-like glycosyltransferase
MFNFVKKYYLFFSLAAIIILYFFTRLFNILMLPIFTDEAIYIHWIQVATNDPSWRFISLTDGRQPMYVWAGIFFYKAISDPLLAGRLVSVGTGFLSTIGMFFLGWELFKNKKIGLLTSFLYVLYPFSLVYDKMALYDSMVAMFIIWILYFTVLLVRHVRFDLGMILGMVIGGGMLTKTNADFGFILLPFSLLLFPFKKHFDRKRLYRFILFSLVALVIANAMYAILRLSPYFYIIGQKNYTFIYSFSDFIRQPFAFVVGNTKGLGEWFVQYITWPFLVLVIASFFVDKKFFREKLFMLIWFVVPFTLLAFDGKVLYPRYLLNMTVSLIPLGAYGFYILQQKTRQVNIKILLFVVFVSMFLVNDYFILTNFADAYIPQPDKGQYLTDWPSGVGVNQTVRFLQQKAQQGKIYVGTEGTYGLMPYALQIYLYKNSNITINGFWPVNSIPPKDLINASKKIPTYVVFYQPCPSCTVIGKAPATWNVTQVFSIKKIMPNTYYTLYKVNPQ